MGEDLDVVGLMAQRAMDEGRDCADCRACGRAEDSSVPICLWVAGWGMLEQKPSSWGVMVNMVEPSGMFEDAFDRALTFRGDIQPEHTEAAKQMGQHIPTFVFGADGEVIEAYAPAEYREAFEAVPESGVEVGFDLSLTELRRRARAAGIKGRSKMKKGELVNALRVAQQTERRAVIA